MANLLLHTCCAPCTTYALEHWRGERLEVVGLWYNPNIHPLREQELRRQGMTSLSRQEGLPLIALPAPAVDYFAAVPRDSPQRCQACFRLRLSQTAVEARERGFDAFSTTLLISPYQKHDLLREVAEAVAREQGVRFLYADLRPGYPESRRRSQELGLYRQQYCGCLFSLRERLSGKSVADEGSRRTSNLIFLGVKPPKATPHRRGEATLGNPQK